MNTSRNLRKDVTYGCGNAHCCRSKDGAEQKDRLHKGQGKLDYTP